jgi:hypothetical protein
MMQVTSGKKWQTSLIKDPSIHHSMIGNLSISTQSLTKAYETKNIMASKINQFYSNQAFTYFI